MSNMHEHELRTALYNTDAGVDPTADESLALIAMSKGRRLQRNRVIAGAVAAVTLIAAAAGGVSLLPRNNDAAVPMSTPTAEPAPTASETGTQTAQTSTTSQTATATPRVTATPRHTPTQTTTNTATTTGATTTGATPAVTTTGATPGPLAPTPAAPVAPPTWERLINAPVPSLCGLPAGTLADGELRGPSAGRVYIPRPESGDFSTMLSGTVVAGGQTFTIVAVACDAGGTPWPQSLVAYANDLTVVDTLDLSDLLGSGRQYVEKIHPGTTELEVWVGGTAQEADEPASMLSKDVSLGVSIVDGRIKAEVQHVHTEQIFAEAAVRTAVAGDPAAPGHFIGSAKDQAREFASVWVGGPDVRITDCVTASGNPLTSGVFPPETTRVCFFTGEGQAVGYIGLQHLGFSEWIATGISFTTTD